MKLKTKVMNLDCKTSMPNLNSKCQEKCKIKNQSQHRPSLAM